MCYHYLGSAVQPLSGLGGKTPIKEKREAWIDSKTLLPVAVDTGASLAVFTFAAKPPVGPLVPPPNFKKEIDYYKGVMGYP